MLRECTATVIWVRIFKSVSLILPHRLYKPKKIAFIFKILMFSSISCNGKLSVMEETPKKAPQPNLDPLVISASSLLPWKYKRTRITR